MTHCGACGLAITPGNTYCPECGSLLTHEPSPFVAATRRSLPPNQPFETRAVDQSASTALACPQCHHVNTAPAAYCDSCGATLVTKVGEVAPANTVASTSQHALPQPVPSDSTNTQRPREFNEAVISTESGPRLQVIAQDGTTGRSYKIEAEQTDVGRTDGNIVLPDDRFVSPRHARVFREGSRLFIQDLASLNGVYKRITAPIPLESGDIFLIGVAVLRFEIMAPTEQILTCAVDQGTQVFGSPPSPRYARISEQTMEGAPRSIFVVTRQETILGREVGDIVFSSDPFMSRRHAAITRNTLDGSYSLLDLGSSNGTFVRVRGQVELAPGDHVRIGQHLFRYDLNNGQVTGQEQAQAR